MTFYLCRNKKFNNDNRFYYFCAKLFFCTFKQYSFWCLECEWAFSLTVLWNSTFFIQILVLVVIPNIYALKMFHYYWVCVVCFNTFATPLLTLNFHSTVKLKNAYERGFFNLLFSQKCALVYPCFAMFFLLVLNQSILIFLLEPMGWYYLLAFQFRREMQVGYWAVFNI